MTRKEMEQCRSLPLEIMSIEKSMRSPKSSEVVVFYKDYRTGTGVPKAKREIDNGEEELRILKAYHKRLINRLKKKLTVAEKFIESVDDSEMRTILRMYYINNMTQEEIGKEIHYTRSTISMKINQFWTKQLESQYK